LWRSRANPHWAAGPANVARERLPIGKGRRFLAASGARVARGHVRRGQR
jgi:hypothetical protein